MAGLDSLYYQFMVKPDIRLQDIHNLVASPQQLRCFLQREGLLGDFGGQCSKCGVGNVAFVKDKEKDGQPVCFWKCSSSKCRARTSPRSGSFFDKSKLTDGQILTLIYCWVNRYPEDIARREISIGSDHTIVDWFNFCRDICQEILLQDNQKIGG